LAAEAVIYVVSEQGALRQGEILSDLTTLVPLARLDQPPNTVNVARVTHPLAIVLSQDCDLEQDFASREQRQSGQNYREDKLLPTILFCEVFIAAEMNTRPGMDRQIWRRVTGNKDERYHYFDKVSAECDALAKGIPEMTVDFKRYFTVPGDYLYAQLSVGIARRTRLLSPYLEHLSTRFCYYQFRVALPRDHYNPEPAS
jgi:hypothetical protein